MILKDFPETKQHAHFPLLLVVDEKKRTRRRNIMKNTNSLIYCAFVIFLSLVFFGCAIGTTKVSVNHAPIIKIESKKEGNLLVKRFTDKRPVTAFIGNKRNGYGMVVGNIGLQDGILLEDLLTQYFAEALREAGYNAVIDKDRQQFPQQNIKFDAVIDGQIVEFWLDLYMAVWHRVGVVIRVLDPDSNKVLWENIMEGAEKRVLWIGATGEYERIIREALTKALNRAAEEFASDRFQQAIKK